MLCSRSTLNLPLKCTKWFNKSIHKRFSHPTKSNATPHHVSLKVALPTGAFAGALSAITGLGGGIIIIPTLVQYSNLNQRVINGTSLLAITFGSSIGSWNYLLANVCNFPIASILASSALFTTGLGVKIANHISNKSLRTIMGIGLLCICPLVMSKEVKRTPSLAECKNPNVSMKETLVNQFSQWKCNLEKRQLPQWIEDNVDKVEYYGVYRGLQFTFQNAHYLFAGAVSGFLSGLLGVGGGLLMTSYLSTVTDMPQIEIVGTSLLAIIPMGLSATVYNLKAGNTSVRTSLAIASTLSLSAWFVSKYIAMEIPDKQLRQALGVTLAVSAFSMLRKAR